MTSDTISVSSLSSRLTSCPCQTLHILLRSYMPMFLFLLLHILLRSILWHQWTLASITSIYALEPLCLYSKESNVELIVMSTSLRKYFLLEENLSWLIKFSVTTVCWYNEEEVHSHGYSIRSILCYLRYISTLAKSTYTFSSSFAHQPMDPLNIPSIPIKLATKETVSKNADKNINMTCPLVIYQSNHKKGTMATQYSSNVQMQKGNITNNMGNLGPSWPIKTFISRHSTKHEIHGIICSKMAEHSLCEALTREIIPGYAS